MGQKIVRRWRFEELFHFHLGDKQDSVLFMWQREGVWLYFSFEVSSGESVDTLCPAMLRVVSVFRVLAFYLFWVYKCSFVCLAESVTLLDTWLILCQWFVHHQFFWTHEWCNLVRQNFGYTLKTIVACFELLAQICIGLIRLILEPGSSSERPILWSPLDLFKNWFFLAILDRFWIGDFFLLDEHSEKLCSCFRNWVGLTANLILFNGHLIVCEQACLWNACEFLLLGIGSFFCLTKLKSLCHASFGKFTLPSKLVNKELLVAIWTWGYFVFAVEVKVWQQLEWWCSHAVGSNHY